MIYWFLSAAEQPLENASIAAFVHDLEFVTRFSPAVDILNRHIKLRMLINN